MKRTECGGCQQATADLVQEDYIGAHRLEGPRDLTDEDHAAIWDKAMRLLEEDRGVACVEHYFDEEG